ncbi:DUF1566 domain-containing protein [Aeromonas diversa]|uniref:Lcl C-terminal domain-containing protein n=1 Tax=Aeromonas diversa TaxID=502790 RepID=UPI0034621784
MKLTASLTLLLTLYAGAAGAVAICSETLDRTVPTARFSDNGNGTVTDLGSGLTWMRCQLGQKWSGTSCSGEPSRFYWQQALQEAERIREQPGHALHGFGGKQAWRLPDAKEILTIYESACIKPTLNEVLFPRAMAGEGKEVQDGYVYLWTSTAAAHNGQVLYLDITQGGLGYRKPFAYPQQVLLVASR